MTPDSTAIAESVRVALFAELLNRAGEARIPVCGSSMLPSIWTGDVLTVRRCSTGEMSVGDVAMFVREERLFAHRVVATASHSLVTQGDNLDSADAPVSQEEFLGRVVGVERPSLVRRIVRRGRHFRRRVVAA
jgi:signal peptidase I